MKQSWCRNGRRWLFIGGGLVVGLGLAGFAFTCREIGAGVREASAASVERYGGNAVMALLQCVEDADLPLQERNRAVWALGQLGDRRALAVLRQHHTGQPCDHRTALCQHELEKAIKLLDGGFNATAWAWRRPDSP